MKKLLFILLSLAALEASAQTKGTFETRNLGYFWLHTYYTNDVMGNVSYILEGRNSLVTLEQPLFKDNAAEFDAYVEKLGKPVSQRIADYHLGSTGSEPIVMPAGMKDYVKSDSYDGMMQDFADIFGDAIVSLPTGMVTEVGFGQPYKWDDVTLEFSRGATTDFPAANILIGGKVYYTHWAPAKAHANSLQISSPEAIDAELTEAKNALESGAQLFIGGHGAAIADVATVEFKISYLKKIKKLLSKNDSAEAFVEAVKAAYPSLPGEEGLESLAAALYSADNDKAEAYVQAAKKASHRLSGEEGAESLASAR